MRKTWNEKLNVAKKVGIKTVQQDFAGMAAGGQMVIVTPKVVEAAIRKIKPGKSMTVRELRQQFAKKYKVDYTCPVSMGIFVRIVAEAAYEDMQAGISVAEVAPFWRIIDAHTPTAKKLTFGTAFLFQQRRKEHLDSRT